MLRDAILGLAMRAATRLDSKCASQKMREKALLDVSSQCTENRALIERNAHTIQDNDKRITRIARELKYLHADNPRTASN